jgi:hypothetical protein
VRAGVRAMSRTCRTDGAIYTIDVRAGRVSVSVALPANVRVRDAVRVRRLVHDGVESALAVLWPGYKGQEPGRPA